MNANRFSKISFDQLKSFESKKNLKDNSQNQNLWTTPEGIEIK